MSQVRFAPRSGHPEKSVLTRSDVGQVEISQRTVSLLHERHEPIYQQRIAEFAQTAT
jgi:hypothetical protein